MLIFIRDFFRSRRLYISVCISRKYFRSDEISLVVQRLEGYFYTRDRIDARLLIIRSGANIVYTKIDRCSSGEKNLVWKKIFEYFQFPQRSSQRFKNVLKRAYKNIESILIERISSLFADHISDVCKKNYMRDLYRKIDGAVLQSQLEKDLDCTITFQTHSILQRFMLRFDHLQLDCNDHLYIYDGAHAVSSYKVNPGPFRFSPTQ